MGANPVSFEVHGYTLTGFKQEQDWANEMHPSGISLIHNEGRAQAAISVARPGRAQRLGVRRCRGLSGLFEICLPSGNEIMEFALS